MFPSVLYNLCSAWCLAHSRCSIHIFKKYFVKPLVLIDLLLLQCKHTLPSEPHSPSSSCPLSLSSWSASHHQALLSYLQTWLHRIPHALCEMTAAWKPTLLSTESCRLCQSSPTIVISAKNHHQNSRVLCLESSIQVSRKKKKYLFKTVLCFQFSLLLFQVYIYTMGDVLVTW